MKIKAALKSLSLFLAGIFFSLNLAQATTYTWTGTSGGSWAVNTNWTSAVSGTWPATGDAVVISNTNGGTQNVWYDAVPLTQAITAAGTVSSLTITQPDSGVNQLSLIRSLNVTSAITLGGTGAGVSMIVIDGATSGTGNIAVTGTYMETISLTSSSITLNNNGILALTVSGTDPGKAGTYFAGVNGSVFINGGSLIQYNSINQTLQDAAQCSISGSLVMTSGTLVIGGTPSSYTGNTAYWDPRLGISGAVNISGGVVSAAKGTLVLNYSGTNSITKLSATSSNISQIMLFGSTQTFVSDASATNAYIGRIVARASGANTKTIGSTEVGGTLAIGYLDFGQGNDKATTTVKLSSNILASSSTTQMIGLGFGATGSSTIYTTLDLNGYNFIGAYSGTTYGSVYLSNIGNTVWTIQNSGAATSTLGANYFNLTGSTVNVGVNSTGSIVLMATGTAGSSNYLGASTSGTITANTIFSYVGSGSASLNSGRMIGGLSVGSGTSNSLLILTSTIFTGTNSGVTINAGGNLALGNNHLYLTPNPTATINIARSGTISSTGTGALYLNTGIGFNVTGTGSGGATISSNVNVSGTYTFDSSHLSGTGLVISGKIVNGALPASIVVNGPVSLSLTGASTYMGGLTVTGGTVYLGNTGAGTGDLVVSGTGNGNALVQLVSSASGMSSVTLSGVTGANGIIDVLSGSMNIPLITVNSGGILQTSATVYSTIAPASGTIVVNNGGTLRTALRVGIAAVENNVGSVILNSGALLTTSTSTTASSGGRIAVYGNFTANAGSTIDTNDSAGGYLAIYGTSATIADGVTLTTPSNGTINTIAMVRGSGTQVLQSGVNLGKLYMRDNDVGSTNSVKLLQLTGTATTVNMIQMTNTETVASGAVNTLRLGCNVISINGLDGNSYASQGRLALDLAGYTFTISGAGWAPQMFLTGAQTSPWTITSSSGTGLFQAQYFNLSSTNTDVTIASNVILQATAAGGTSELGLKIGGAGTIDANSTFLYGGNGTHYLKTTNSRSIGNLQVGDGSNASKLGLLSNITTGAGSTVNVNLGSTLDLQNFALNTSGNIQLNGGAVTGSAGSSFNIAGKVTASGTANSSISAPVALSGTQTFEVTNAATSLSIAGNISGATGGLTKTGAGSLFLNGNNTYAGLTQVNAGELGINGTLTADGGVNVSSGANLSGTGIVSGTVNNSGAIIGGLTFNNDVTINNGATAAAKAFNSNIVNNGTITSDVTVQSGKTLSGSGVAGTVNVQSATIDGNGMNLGATTFDGQSTLKGTTTAANVTVNSGTTTASGVHTSNDNLAVNADSTLKNTGSFSANIVNIANTATLTNNGTLNGTVNVSGLLNGTGTVNGALTIKTNGELAPGNSPGTTTVAGDLTVETGAKISMQIEGIATAGSDYDQIVVTGASSLVTLNAGSILNLTITDGVFTEGTLTLIENQSENAIVGTFGSVVIGGSTYDVSTSNKFSYNGTEYELLYNVNADGGSKANDFELAVVPEPGTWAMLVGGLGMLLGAQRMRRRSE